MHFFLGFGAGGTLVQPDDRGAILHFEGRVGFAGHPVAASIQQSESIVWDEDPGGVFLYSESDRVAALHCDGLDRLPPVLGIVIIQRDSDIVFRWFFRLLAFALTCRCGYQHRQKHRGHSDCVPERIGHFLLQSRRTRASIHGIHFSEISTLLPPPNS